MLKKLKHVLNTYSDKELEGMELWVNSNDTINEIIIDDYSINLISKDMYVDVRPEEYMDCIQEKYKNEK